MATTVPWVLGKKVTWTKSNMTFFPRKKLFGKKSPGENVTWEKSHVTFFPRKKSHEK